MPRTPINYQNTIIYKIVCNDLNIKDLYVGHTTDFKRRKSQHKHTSQCDTNKDYNCKIYKVIRENGGWDNWTMVEIEKFSCNDSKEATARERHWFEILEAKMNSQFPQRNVKEYNEANKDTIKERAKQYREKNKPKAKEYHLLYKQQNIEKLREIRNRYYNTHKAVVNEKRNIKLNCECGRCYTLRNKIQHSRSIKHTKFVEEQNI